MGRRSCHHCGIKNTTQWRKGPSEKPTLCNPCGTAWSLRGTLAGYVPKHGLTPMEKLAEKSNAKGLPFSIKVPTRKRSVLPQYYLTHIGRLHRQLLQIQHEQQSGQQSTEKTWLSEEENEVLIDNSSMMISCNETLLGAMLLK